MRLRLLLLFLSLGLGWGCSDGSDGVGGSPQASTSAGDEPAPVGSSTSAERAAKQAYREPGTREEAAIDLEAARAHPRADVSALSGEARAAIARASLPVLLPRDGALLAGAVITEGDTWYEASLHPPGHHVRINGRRAVVHQPTLSADVPDRRPAWEPAISRTHSIVSAAFEAFGVAYLLEVECDAPTTDARCTEDAYARSLVASLGVAGGDE